MAGTDYGDSLRSTLDAARQQILDLGRSAAATRQQAAITLGHAEQALSVAENGLDRNLRDLVSAYVITSVAVQGGALIRSADQLADLAKAEAGSANSALAVAATSIKTLASAFDTLAGSIAGVSAVASDDFGSAMFRSAKRAEDATNSADDTVERLKAAALVASIQSARSEATAAAASVNAVGSEIQGLVDRAGALLSATQPRMNDSMKQRAAAAQAERAAEMTYRQAKIDSEALDDGATSLDGVLNGSLAVTMKLAAPAAKPDTAAKPADTTQKAMYTLDAQYTIPFQSGDVCYFFALLEHDATAFSYNDAKTAVVEFDTARGASLTRVPADPRSTPGAPITYSAPISTTTTGDPITPGQSYRVFAFRVAKDGPYATNASDLSYPSRAIAVARTIPDQEKYRIDFPPRSLDASEPGAAPPQILFKVPIQPPPTAAHNIMEYRAFLLLEDVYQAIRAVQDDTVLIASLLAPSSYKRWPDNPAGDSSGPPLFIYREGDTDAYGDIVTPDTNYELMVLLVPKDETMKSALLPAVPFKTGAPVATVIPASPPSGPQVGPPPSPGSPPSPPPAPGAAGGRPGASTPQTAAPASRGA